MKHLKQTLALILVLALLVQTFPLNAAAAPAEEAPSDITAEISADPSAELSPEASTEPALDDPEEAAPVQELTGTVLGELPERRDASEKHFRLSDGSFSAVDYGMTVHYSEDEGETWSDIDNTLEFTEDKLYTAQNGSHSRAFAPDLTSGFLYSVGDGTREISFSLVSSAGLSGDELYFSEATAEISYPNEEVKRAAAPEDFASQVLPSRLCANVSYSDVAKDVDLLYALNGFNVKETVRLNAPQETSTFAFQMELTGLQPILDEDGSVLLTDESGATIYQIPAPYMTDARGASSDAVCYSLSQNGSNIWIFTIHADEEWLNEPDRVYPVDIDPTIIDKESWTAQGFGLTYVESGHTATSHYQHQNLYWGYTPYLESYEMQIFIGWDNFPVIPAAHEVVSSCLYLYQFDFQSVPNHLNGEIAAVTGTRPSAYTSNYEWICNLTWGTKPAVSDTPEDYARLSSETTDSFVCWDITGMIRNMYTNTTAPRAACLRLNNVSQYNGNNYGCANFRGYGSSTGPLFVVSYRDTTGIEPYYTYQTLGADRAGAVYISDYTGNVTTVTPLVSYASTVNPFSLSLIYNSSYFSVNASAQYISSREMGYGFNMGNGMKLNLMQTIKSISLQYELNGASTKTYLKYTDGDGTIHYFAKKDNAPSDPYYYDEDGLGLKIKQESGYYRMEDDKGNTWFFYNGILTTMEDANGNQISLRFKLNDGTEPQDGRPSGNNDYIHHIVTKNNGQNEFTVATFAYSGADASNRRLTSITDAAGNQYSFDYNSNYTRITAIKRSNTNYVSYSYSGNRITSLKDDISKFSLRLSYTGGKVFSFSEKGDTTTGAGATITRKTGESAAYRDWGNDRTVNDSDDIITTYLFDYAGRTVNAYSMDAAKNILGASASVYSGTGGVDKKNNRTLRWAGRGKEAMPLLRNGGFDLTGTECGWTMVIPSDSCNVVLKTGQLARTGTTALKSWIGSSDVTSPVGAYKTTEQLSINKQYTASIYVNTSQATVSSSSVGVYLQVEAPNGTTFTSDYLRAITNTAIEGGWVRISCTFLTPQAGNYTVSVFDEGITGVVFYDDLQVERSDAPSNVNLLNNAGMTRWAEVWLNQNGSAASFKQYCSCQNNGTYDYSLKITGDPSADNYAYQTVKVHLPGTQTYLLSGWAKATAATDNVTYGSGDQGYASDTYKQFGLRAVLTYDDNTTEYHYVPFNPAVTDWQYASLSIVPKQPTKTVETIKVICAYEKNINFAYFDNISLTREVAQTMAYDSNGNLVSVQSTNTEEETQTFTNGNLTQVNAGNGVTYNYDYDNHHNLTGASNGTVKEQYSYDSMGNVITTDYSDEDHFINSIYGHASYGDLGNVLATKTDARGKVTRYFYGETSNEGHNLNDSYSMYGIPSLVTAPNGVSTQTTILDDGRVSATEIVGTVAVERIYNGKNELTGLVRSGYNGTDELSQKYNFIYDAFGNTTNISVGTSNPQTLASYTYGNCDGLLSLITYGNGDRVGYTYDILGRQTEVNTYHGNGTQPVDTYKYTYTGDGQLYSLTDVNGGLRYQYNYDTLGRLISSDLWQGSTLAMQTSQQYDTSNRLTEQKWSFADLSYGESFTYDATKGRLTSQTFSLPGNASSAVSLTYEALSRLLRADTPQYRRQYTYLNGSGSFTTTTLVSQLQLSSQITGGFSTQTYSYTYDNVGNITQIVGPGGTTSYSYDNQNQLLEETGPYGTQTYVYDTVGNLRRKTDQNNVAYSYGYGDTVWDDRLTSLTVSGVSHSYTYDASGNPTSYYAPGDNTTWSMTWKNGRELSSAVTSEKTLSFDYDVNGLRTRKTANGVEHSYYYASGKLLREEWTSGSTIYRLDFLYDFEGKPYAVRYANGANSAWFYYLTNLQGDVVGLINENSVLVASYTYDAWGNLLSSSGTFAKVNPLRYRGYYYDTETGFYYLQSRYYDPALGRFLNADSYASTGQGFLGYNMFAYCGNNPTGWNDQTGHFCTRPVAVNDSFFDKDVTPKATAPSSITVTTTHAKLGQVHFNSYSRVSDNLKQSATLYLEVTTSTGSSELIGLTGPYNELKKLASGTGLEVHHLIEKRFFSGLHNVYPSEGAMPSVIIDHQSHVIYTNAWRKEFAYAKTNYSEFTSIDAFYDFALHLYGDDHPEWMSYLYD